MSGRFHSEHYEPRERSEESPHDEHAGAHTFNGAESKETRRPAVLSKRQFLEGFQPPDYLIDGILQRRFFYALTGQTGHAKTALALLLTQLVASADDAYLGSHRVEKGRVVYFVGENPDDVRTRLIGADAMRSGDPDTDRISFVSGIFDIDKMHSVLVLEMEKLGGIDLIVVDTSAAYFLGSDELSNPQMGQYARMLRRLTTLPGGPCLLTLCHPIKHATEPSQLLPRGGGAFLAEVDGNLTVWKRDDLIDLHHGKIRGPGFEPITFRLDRFTTPRLVDRNGRMMPTVRAVPISESEEERQANNARDEEDRLLFAMRTKPDRSMAELARACGWTQQNGDPAKSRVQRVMGRLEKAKLVKKERNVWHVTDRGTTTADAAAARFATPEPNAQRCQE
jgi:AAA domain